LSKLEKLYDEILKRIILDTQSNRVFRGLEIEQSYDQRGGLCQVGKGHLVVTTNPFDPDYIDYWKELGYTIPYLITAGPFDPLYTLSELIIQKKRIQEEIKAFAQDRHARLEFFCIEETEAELSRVLGIEAYCNFDVSIRFSRKILFKDICITLSLPTPPWIFYEDKEQLWEKGKKLLASGIPILIKANDGTGGISCGGIFKANTVEDLETVIMSIRNSEEIFFMEKLINKVEEVALHWEITEDGAIRIIGLFDQISKDCSYGGVSYPAAIPRSLRNLIESQLKGKLGPYLVQKGGKGYFCCDIIIDHQEVPYWIDFNPRKGAILYVWDMVRRLSKIHLNSVACSFWHEHFQVSSENGLNSFREIARKISDFLRPGEKPFVVITNPGVIRFGYVDITGISKNSKSEAQEIFEEAKRRLI
jgi:hypothetical protein